MGKLGEADFVIFGAVLEELLVGADPGDLPIVEHHDPVRTLDRIHPLGDEENGGSDRKSTRLNSSH